MDFTNFDESQKFPPPLQIEENLESPKMLHFFVKTANLKGRTWLKNFPPLKLKLPEIEEKNYCFGKF